MKNKKILVLVSSLAIVLSFTLASCGASNNGGELTTAAKNGIVTVMADTGGISTFPQNFNVNTSAVVAPGNALFYEGLFRMSTKNIGELIPNLALSESFSHKNKWVTYKLREGVKWNDGVEFTAKDVKWSYDRILGGGVGAAAQFCNNKKCFLTEPIHIDSKYQVTMKYSVAQPQEDMALALWFPVMPEHIYSKVGDPDKYVDKNPVGTGPGKLISFNQQKIRIGIRDDYWGGKSQGVKEVDIVPAGTAANTQAALSSSKADFAVSAQTGIANSFVAKNPTNNKYQFFADGSSRGILFGTTVAPTNDKYVREALRESADLTIAQKAVDTDYPIPTLTGLNTVLDKKYLLPGYENSLTPNVEKAKQALIDGGWTVNSKGNLEKDGKEYPLTLWVNVSQAVDMVVAPTITAEWKKNLGLNVNFKTKADMVFKNDSYKGTNQMIVWTTTGGGVASKAYVFAWNTLTAKAHAEDWGNQGLWKCSAETNEAIKKMTYLTMNQESETIKLMRDVQQAVVDEAPFMPLFGGGSAALYNNKNWSGWPVFGESDYSIAVKDNAIGNFIQTVMHLTPTK